MSTLTHAELSKRFKIEFEVKAKQECILDFNKGEVDYGEVEAGENIVAYITDTENVAGFEVDVRHCTDDKETFDLIVMEIQSYLDRQES